MGKEIYYYNSGDFCLCGGGQFFYRSQWYGAGRAYRRGDHFEQTGAGQYRYSDSVVKYSDSGLWRVEIRDRPDHLDDLCHGIDFLFYQYVIRRGGGHQWYTVGSGGGRYPAGDRHRCDLPGRGDQRRRGYHHQGA